MRLRTTLFGRLFAAYAGVLSLAVLALTLAPVTISVPITTGELVGVLIGFAIMLVLYRVLLRRSLAPLQRLTELMHRVDPLRPGQRISAATHDEELTALAEAFIEMLVRLETERRESGRRALAAQEAERRRIARELHDEIGQLLTGLMLQSETLSRRAPAELARDVENLREGARNDAEEVREIAQRLRPEALDELGLQSALLALTTVAERAGLLVERRLDRDVELSAEEELVVYRVAQEGLTNVVRHAGASRVWLTLNRGAGGEIVLEVRDDGRGIPPDAERRSSGLRGMRERALLVGGRLSVRRAEPRGTQIVLSLPGGRPS